MATAATDQCAAPCSFLRRGRTRAIHTAFTRAKPCAGLRRLERCRRFILEHYAQPLSLHDLAEVSATSRSHLVRSFKQAFGLAPHAYHIHVRIEKARALLARGVPLASVAAEIGFADQSHFGRHFLQIVGVTPAKYAKQLNAAASTDLS
jgi:AraC-like DNA-binding protein